MKVADHVTKEAYTINEGGHSNKTLPANSFVQPIHEYYLPRHIREGEVFKWWSRDTQVFVYCHYGIVLIPRSIIREVG